MNSERSPFDSLRTPDGQDEPWGDWSPDHFRTAGHATVDWIADYLERVGDLPVRPDLQPGDISARLPKSAPENPEDIEAFLEDLAAIVEPGMTHWNHPGFLAYFGITSSGPGILAEAVAAAFNPNGMLWKTSPVSTELELRVMDWMAQMCDLPDDWFGFLLDTASMATFLALAAARQSIEGWNVREEGLKGGPQLCVYASDQAHASVEKAALALGFGRVGFRAIDTDGEFRMRPDLLERAIAEDRSRGYVPCAVVGTVGTTSTTSVDPIAEIAAICLRESVWLHVDAAYAGSAALMPSKQKYFVGCDLADSYVFNPHKWLFVPIDATAFYTRHPDVLREAFELVPDYLRSDDGGTDLMHYGLQMGRRFRALKLWWVLRAFGVRGLRARITFHCDLADTFARWIRESSRFELFAPVPFSTVCFRGIWSGVAEEDTDRRNEELARRVTATGRAFLATTKLRGRAVIRVAIGNIRTDATRLEEVFGILEAEHESLQGSGSDRSGGSATQ